MEYQIIDYYSETNTMFKVIEKMNSELEIIQNKYDNLKKIYEPDKTIEQYILNSHSSHNDMAKLMFKLYGKEICCTSISKNEWYFFDSTIKKWRLSDGGIELRIKLSTELQNIYQQKLNQELDNMAKQENEYEEELYRNRYNSYIGTFCNLKKNAYKKNVMRECKDVFYNKDFKSLNKFIIEDVEDYYEYY